MKRNVRGTPMTAEEYRRRIAEAWRQLEAKVCVPSLTDYLDAIRPVWRESIPIPVRSGQSSKSRSRSRAG
jgi:hypothetical protein